jgi:hypothetical protein
MAFSAIRSQPGFVHILMTGYTISKVFSPVILEDIICRCLFSGLVTGSTVYFPVLAYQRKFGFVVIEGAVAYKHPKRFFCMAFFAIGAKASLVHVFVTHGAGVKRNP